MLMFSRASIRIGDGSYKSHENISIRIPIPNGSFLVRDVNVVEADIPLSIGLDMTDDKGIRADNIENKLICPKLNRAVSITRKLRLLYLCCYERDILFTKLELLCLHRHFYLPSTDKLMGLIKE